MVDADWTFEEAMEAQRAFEQKHGPFLKRIATARSDPIHQWHALQKVEKCKKSHGTGRDPGAVLHAIFLCGFHGLPIPTWAEEAFREQYYRGLDGDLGSWDEAFGHPNTKAKRERQFRDSFAPLQIWEKPKPRTSP